MKRKEKGEEGEMRDWSVDVPMLGTKVYYPSVLLPPY